MKAAITALLAIFSASSMGFADTEISDFQWKNRLLIVPNASEQFTKQLKSEKVGLTERDLRVFVLAGVGRSEFPTSPELTTEFEQRLSPRPEKPKVYLIGKDGRTTLEWTMETFSFKKLYASIDAMPMRQREMRENR